MVLADVARCYYRHAPRRLLLDEAGERDAFIKAEELHLAGLADGEQAVRAVGDVPLDQVFEALVVDRPFFGEGGQHDGDDAVDLVRHGFGACGAVMGAES